jgi:hypothetical protein
MIRLCIVVVLAVLLAFCGGEKMEAAWMVVVLAVLLPCRGCGEKWKMKEGNNWCKKVYNNYGGKGHVSLYYWLTTPDQHSFKKIDSED